jgi:hypothetical protein
MASSFFERVSKAVEQKAGPRSMNTALQRNLPLAKKLLSGDIGGALNTAIDEAFGIRSRNSLFGQQAPFPGPFLVGNIPLLGGITAQRAREIFEESAGLGLAKKNLWSIYISDLFDGGESINFNLIATDVAYTPITIAGEAVNIGSGSYDHVTGTERVEMRVTTLDDQVGTLKTWFKDRADRVCRNDGTFGVPLEYLLRVEVRHAFIEGAEGEEVAYVDKFIMRPATQEIELSRREDAMQEIQLSFVQFDTFTNML